MIRPPARSNIYAAWICLGIIALQGPMRPNCFAQESIVELANESLEKSTGELANEGLGEALDGRLLTRKIAYLGKGKAWQTVIHISDSGIAGPTVIVTGGIHGNEPAGARAAEQIRRWPIVQGKLIVIPRVNVLGLNANTRYLPDATAALKDLNRNFPVKQADVPRGEIATALWEFVVDEDPDWLFDLHEGYEFNISHQPKPGKAKSVGSSIIYDQDQPVGVVVQRMHAAANATVTDPARKFTLLRRGPKRTSLASGVINVLDKHAMILETTYQFQPMAVRTRQHREMMYVALRFLKMIDTSQVDPAQTGATKHRPSQGKPAAKNAEPSPAN